MKIRRAMFMSVWAAALGLFAASLDSSAEPSKTPTKVLELRVFPSSLELDNARDARRLVVSGRTPDGFWADLTDKATITPQAPLVNRDKDGFFHPAKAGTTSLQVRVAGVTAAVP